MNRADFHALALTRLEDARILLQNGRADGAYYVAGYVVECALKACISNTNQYDFPPDVKFVQEVYSHNLGNLLKKAGLELQLQHDAPPGSPLDTNWAKVLRWSEQYRYRIIQTHADATGLYNAIADPTNGVLAWLQQNW